MSSVFLLTCLATLAPWHEPPQPPQGIGMGLPETTSSHMPLFILGSTAAWTAAITMPDSLLLSYLTIGCAAQEVGKKKRGFWSVCELRGKCYLWSIAHLQAFTRLCKGLAYSLGSG